MNITVLRNVTPCILVGSRESFRCNCGIYFMVNVSIHCPIKVIYNYFANKLPYTLQVKVQNYVAQCFIAQFRIRKLLNRILARYLGK